MKKDPYAPLRDQMSEAPTHWRSVDEKAGNADLAKDLEVEFPRGATAPDAWNRREALKLAAASLSMGALTACGDDMPKITYSARRTLENDLPYARMPENVIPGVRMHYSTAMQRSEGAVGLLVEAHEGRPTKIEGNPSHPSSLGSSDIWAQAEVLRLYDPERRKAPLNSGADSTWEKWDTFAKEHFSHLVESQGKGLAFLLGEDMGPTFERVHDAARVKFPQAKTYRWDALAPDNALSGAQLAFGPGARVHYNLEKAKVIWSVDSDFLTTGPDHLRLARQFGKTRAVHSPEDAEKMARLYASEGAYTNTGSNADHRLTLASGQQPELMKAVVNALVTVHNIDLGELASAVAGATAPLGAEKFVAALAKDLASHRGEAVLFVGERQPTALHALAHGVNAALGGLGTVFKVSQGPNAVRVPMSEQLAALAAGLTGGEIETLVIFDLNPLYTAPGGVKMAEALAKAKTLIHAGIFPEETGMKATWHVPLAHFLESWGDARAFDGTVSLVQPIVHPLFGGRPSTSLLAQLSLESDTDDKKLLDATWRGPNMEVAKATAAIPPAPAALPDGGTPMVATKTGAAAQAAAAAEVKTPAAPSAADVAKYPLVELRPWRHALHDGLVSSTTRPDHSGDVRRADIAQAVSNTKGQLPSKDALELVAVFGHPLDGRLTNVSWIMELPDSMSKLSWDNAVLLSPTLAKELGINSGVYKNRYAADVVELSVEGRKITGPTFVLPGLARNTLVVTHGYGRDLGEVSKGIGMNVNPVLGTGNVVQNVKLTKTGAQIDLCSTQDHFAVPGNPFKQLTFAQMAAEPNGAVERSMGLGNRNLYRTSSGEAWKKDPETFHRADMPEDLVQLGTPKSRPSKPIQLSDDIVYEGQQWGMVIDLSSCIGCNICTVACIAENNIPVVGREQVLLGREMHWIRIDRYFMGDVENPTAVHQPVNCMHCENAPCEPVCPVGATTHDEEGLNSMAYNRCIGTRYCNNNCPYKVRRFNYLDFTHTGQVYVDPYWKERMKTLKLQRNPDVTVRYRGVMEKCTYCTQRIEQAKMAAKRAGNDRKALPDGAVTPACAQACPTQAITFGNINDETSRVHALKQSERNYEMLQELNVRPRTTYLAHVRNENQELSS